MKKKNKKKDRCVPNRRQNARQMWSHSRRFLKGKNGYHSVERDGNEWRTASAGHIQLDGCASKFLWQRHLPFCRCLFHIIYHRRSKCSASHTHTFSVSLSLCMGLHLHRPFVGEVDQDFNYDDGKVANLFLLLYVNMSPTFTFTEYYVNVLLALFCWLLYRKTV
jgi:hypothetical protein